MAQPAVREASYADLVALPDNVVGEIIDGVLYSQPRPAPKHGVASSRAGARINLAFGNRQPSRDGPGGWWIVDEPECAIGPNVVVPDIAGWRRTTMPRLPETAQFMITPDWICEVVSTGTARKDRMLKLPKYVQAGVGWAWLIDPSARTVEVFENGGGRWIWVGTYDGDDPVAIAPFAEIEFDIGALWDTGE